MIESTVCGIAWIICLVCFIILLVRMFQSGATNWGIAAIVLWLCCNIGYVVAFIWGWRNVGTRVSQNFMIIYTVMIVILIISGGYGVHTGIFHVPG